MFPSHCTPLGCHPVQPCRWLRRNLSVDESKVIVGRLILHGYTMEGGHWGTLRQEIMLPCTTPIPLEETMWERNILSDSQITYFLIKPDSSLPCIQQPAICLYPGIDALSPCPDISPNIIFLLPTYLPTYPPTHPHNYPHTYLPTYLPTYPPNYPPTHLPTHPPT